MNILDRIIARLRSSGTAPAGDELARLQQSLAEALKRGERIEAIALCDRILARTPDDRSVLLAAAINRLKTGEPQRAAEHFARIDELESNGENSARLLTESYIDPDRAGRGEPYVASLDDVLIDTDFWSVIEGERIYSRETQARTMSNSPRVRGRVTPDASQCVMTLPRKVESIDAPSIFLASDANYAHWLLRNLPKLCLLENAGLPPDLPYLVGDNLRGWHRAYLELLGIAQERLLKVPVERVFRCRRLYVPTQLRNHPRMAEGIAWLQAKVARLRAAPAEAAALLYASRREQPNRRLLNEAEVEDMLAKRGFRIIVPGQMSVPEQIAAFSAARVVVGPHGAALANMIFAPRGATMVEIVSAAALHMDELRHLAAAAGQRARTVLCEDMGDATRGAAPARHHGDYRVDLGELRAALDEVLGA